MATIYNSDLQKEFTEGSRVQVAREGSVTQISQQVIPVMEVNPKLLRRVNIIAKVSAAGTAYTCPADKDFYLTGCFLAGAISQAAKSGSQSLTITLPGGAATILNSNFVRTSAVLIDAGQSVSNQNYTIPILCSRGSTLTYSTSNMDAQSCTIIGYLVENVYS